MHLTINQGEQFLQTLFQVGMDLKKYRNKAGMKKLKNTTLLKEKFLKNFPSSRDGPEKSTTRQGLENSRTLLYYRMMAKKKDKKTSEYHNLEYVCVEFFMSKIFMLKYYYGSCHHMKIKHTKCLLYVVNIHALNCSWLACLTKTF